MFVITATRYTIAIYELVELDEGYVFVEHETDQDWSDEWVTRVEEPWNNPGLINERMITAAVRTHDRYLNGGATAIPIRDPLNDPDRGFICVSHMIKPKVYMTQNGADRYAEENGLEYIEVPRPGHPGKKMYVFPGLAKPNCEWNCHISDYTTTMIKPEGEGYEFVE